MRLSEIQRSKLCRLIEMAFLDISVLASTGKPRQAADLANVFHQLPAGMWRQSFNLKLWRDRELCLFYARHRGAKIRKQIVKYMQKVNDVLDDAGKDFAKN